MRLGDIVNLSVSQLHPTQPDDGRPPAGYGPLEVYKDNGEWYVQHGNHRYYQAIHVDPHAIIEAKIVKNPYFDF